MDAGSTGRAEQARPDAPHDDGLRHHAEPQDDRFYIVFVTVRGVLATRRAAAVAGGLSRSLAVDPVAARMLNHLCRLRPMTRLVCLDPEPDLPVREILAAAGFEGRLYDEYETLRMAGFAYAHDESGSCRTPQGRSAVEGVSAWLSRHSAHASDYLILDCCGDFEEEQRRRLARTCPDDGLTLAAFRRAVMIVERGPQAPEARDPRIPTLGLGDREPEGRA
jgi:hypothetical protein